MVPTTRALNRSSTETTEIDQQSHTKARGLEVIYGLRPMLGRDLTHSLQFDDHPIEAYEIRFPRTQTYTTVSPNISALA